LDGAVVVTADNGHPYTPPLQLGDGGGSLGAERVFESEDS
jgi:hypothetical protein